MNTTSQKQRAWLISKFAWPAANLWLKIERILNIIGQATQRIGVFDQFSVIHIATHTTECHRQTK